ncbi:ATP-binding protein [Candidatus Marithrix sp. Canyon 246]|uniref:ATP-binding protein n=1 Tax=Candidatus Marithrix sp. Canyon 246 TaxID=1827136 RepID=UPI00084A0268|nr:ATP-binding protein [Candidatus Marithrix sp. Canyon 246]
MQLLPSSLFGRLVIVLLIGLLIAQLLSSIILFKARQQQISKIQQKHLSQRIFGTLQVLDSLASKERIKFVKLFDTLRLRVSLNLSAPNPEDCLPVVENFLESIDRSLCLIEFEKPAAHPPFLVKIQLQDGSWIGFKHIHPIKTTIAPPWKLLIILAILLITVLILSLLAVRWLTRPLAILAEAAEHLGRDIHQPPLSENGPIEVRRAAHAFNTMQARLSRYLEDRARILIAVSHDLKTPITRLRLRVEQLEDNKLRDSFIRDLDDMQSMTTATLDFMRGLENTEQVQSLDIRALLESLQADYEEMAKPFTIQGDTPKPYPARPLSLKRCLVNLIDNAHKYGQQVTVSLKNQPEQLQITIADRGAGIPETALETVFEPFYRLETSRSRSTGGTGLGLSIARNIARSHGGEIILRNRINGGLEAILSLP